MAAAFGSRTWKELAARHPDQLNHPSGAGAPLHMAPCGVTTRSPRGLLAHGANPLRGIRMESRDDDCQPQALSDASQTPIVTPERQKEIVEAAGAQ